MGEMEFRWGTRSQQVLSDRGLTCLSCDRSNLAVFISSQMADAAVKQLTNSANRSVSVPKYGSSKSLMSPVRSGPTPTPSKVLSKF